MIGAIVAATMLAAAPQPATQADVVRSFVAALLIGRPANRLPYVAPRLRVELDGYTNLRPDLGETLESLESALKTCVPTGVEDLGGDPKYGYFFRASLKCQDDDEDASKKLRLSLRMGDGMIERVTLTIGDPVAPPSVVRESAEDKAARQRAEAVARAYFQRLGAGEITREHAPRSGVIMRVKGVFETPNLEWLHRIFAGCEMRSFSILSSSGGAGDIYVAGWTCPAGAPDPAPTVAFKIVGTDIDEVRVIYSTAHVSEGK